MVSTRTVGSLLGVVSGAIATGVLLVVGLVGGLLMVLTGRRGSPPPSYGPPAWPGRPGPYGTYGGGPYPPGGQPAGTAPWGPPPGTAPPRHGDEPTVTVRPSEHPPGGPGSPTSADDRT